MKISYALATGAALLTAGCSTPKLIGSENIQVVDGRALPPPERSDLAALDRAYLIGPYDKLSVDVFGVPDLSREVQADASGRLSLPLVGSVEAAGKTPAELGILIEERLRGRYVREPQVTVNLVETVSQVITVDGEVRQPGLYPVIGRMTLMRAIATAQGTTEFALKRYVVVFRTVRDQQLAALYDLKAIRQGIYDDPEVFANDVVVVGESEARRLFRDIVQGSSLITAPVVAAVRN